jgi:hypothetical protein
LEGLRVANTNNVNENGFVKNPITMSNNNVNVTYDRAKVVDAIVDKLEAGLNAKPESRAFLCKAAWRLSEARIWLNYEKSLMGTNPMGLFIWLCKKDGV